MSLANRYPYGSTARVYFDKNWLGPLPLPPCRKEKPPGNYTGRGAPYPTARELDSWSKGHRRGNIAQRLGSVEVDGVLYDIVGVDVDHYVTGGKRKRGARQLRALEAEHGKLPATWTSTARTDGRSGIRFFLGPAGLLWLGKAAPDIDVISPGYRYSVVYPSVHPDGMVYRWYPPGQRPDGVHYVNEIPDPANFPMLPNAWIVFLTNDRQVEEGVDIDMDSTDDELMRWALKALPHGAEPCARMRHDLDRWLAAIADDPSSHDKIKDAHWNLLHNAAEGHSGWPAAVEQVETTWLADVLQRHKRSRRQAAAEINRSKVKALRKLKGESDAHAEMGLEFVAAGCTCAVSITVAGRTFRPRGPRRPARPKRYSA